MDIDERNQMLLTYLDDNNIEIELESEHFKD